MDKTIESLIPDIHALFNQDEDHIVNEENLEVMAESIKAAVRDGLRRYERKGSLRFSALGKQPRQIWYDEHLDASDAEKLTPDTLLKFQYGHLLEALLLFLAKEAGHDVSCEQEEVEVDGVKGHLDAVIDGHVIDVKSASSYGFKKFEAGELTPENDAFGYIRQLSGYATVKNLPAAFLAIDKVSGQLALSPLSSYAIKGHPPVPRIEMLKQVIAKNEPPKRCYDPEPDGKSGNMKLSTPCSYCKWKWKCHPDLRGFAYSNGPRYLTRIVREPDVYEFTDKKDDDGNAQVQE